MPAFQAAAIPTLSTVGSRSTVVPQVTFAGKAVSLVDDHYAQESCVSYSWHGRGVDYVTNVA